MLKLQWVVMLLTVATLGLPVWHAPTQTTHVGLKEPPIVSVADAPAGTETLAVQWLRVADPDLGVMLAAVARPSGGGPFRSAVRYRDPPRESGECRWSLRPVLA